MNLIVLFSVCSYCTSFYTNCYSLFLNGFVFKLLEPCRFILLKSLNVFTKLWLHFKFFKGIVIYSEIYLVFKLLFYTVFLLLSFSFSVMTNKLENISSRAFILFSNVLQSV